MPIYRDFPASHGDYQSVYLFVWVILPSVDSSGILCCDRIQPIHRNFFWLARTQWCISVECVNEAFPTTGLKHHEKRRGGLAWRTRTRRTPGKLLMGQSQLSQRSVHCKDPQHVRKEHMMCFLCLNKWCFYKLYMHWTPAKQGWSLELCVLYDQINSIFNYYTYVCKQY